MHIVTAVFGRPGRHFRNRPKRAQTDPITKSGHETHLGNKSTFVCLDDPTGRQAGLSQCPTDARRRIRPPQPGGLGRPSSSGRRACQQTPAGQVRTVVVSCGAGSSDGSSGTAIARRSLGGSGPESPGPVERLQSAAGRRKRIAAGCQACTLVEGAQPSAAHGCEFCRQVRHPTHPAFEGLTAKPGCSVSRSQPTKTAMARGTCVAYGRIAYICVPKAPTGCHCGSTSTNTPD